MKKLIIIATHPVQYQVPLWKKMTEAGIDLEVWYFTDFGTKKSYDVQFGKSFSWDLPMLEGYKYRFLKTNKNAAPNKGFRGIILKDNLRQKLKKHKATHVYINGWQVLGYWQALFVASSLKLTIIFKGESNDLKPEIKWKWPIKKILLNQFFNKIDYFLYIGKANKRLYEKYGIPDRKLLPGLYCIDNDRFTSDLENQYLNRDKLRSKWHIHKDDFCILFSGKFISKKRPLDIVNAAKKLISESYHSKIHLLFVGHGELFNSIKAETNVLYDSSSNATNSGEKKRVNISFTGFLNQTEIPQAYIASDCLVLPSDYGETWGLVVNEAMACGLPAIVSDQCGSAEDLIKPLSNNLVYPTGDIEKLANAISYLIEHPIEKELINERISKYSFTSTVDSVKKILNKE